MTAQEKLAPLAAKLHAALADEKQRVNLLVCTGLAGLVLLGSGRADGLVETVQTPQVLGVAVVCEGGGNAAVQNRVTALVEALTGVGANHITVAKMASTNEEEGKP